jgi:hypothetical protein
MSLHTTNSIDASITCTNLSKYNKEKNISARLKQITVNHEKFWDFNPEISNNNHIEPHMYFVETLKMTKK